MDIEEAPKELKTVKTPRATLWKRFGEDAVNFIKSNDGIASMNDIFTIAANIFPKLVWSTPKLEEMAKYLIANNNCYRIDLQIDYPKPLAIYPGHHKLTSTTFFVLSDASTSTEASNLEYIAKARKILDDLIEKAAEIGKSKRNHPKCKKVNPDQEQKESKNQKLINEINIDHQNNHTTAFELVANGYIPMAKLQVQILHDFILDTFGTQSFSVDDIINEMSFDIISKIAGVKFVPRFILTEPKLRHVLLRCFPDRILDLFDFEEIRNSIYHIIIWHCTTKKLINPVFFTCISPDNHLTKPECYSDRYVLVQEAKIDFFNSIEFKYNLLNEIEFRNFLDTFRSIELIENIEPHSYQLWAKRYSLARSYRSNPSCITKSIVEKTIHEPYQYTFPFTFSEVENYVSEHGENWITLQGSVLSEYNKNEESINRSKMNPRSGPIYEFCENVVEKFFKTNPDLYIESLTSSNFENLKGLDKNVVFNYLSAMMQLTAKGLIVNLPKPWNFILEMHKEITNIDKDEFLNNTVPQNYHMFLMSTYRDYSDFHHYMIAKQSIENKNIDQNELNSIEMCTDDYLSRFNLTRVRFNLPIRLAELIQYMKIVSLTPADISLPILSKKILSELDTSQIEDAVLYLKLSKFITEKVETYEPEKIVKFKVNKKLIYDFNLYRPYSLYENIIKYFNLAKDPNHVESAAESNSGVVAYLLDPESSLTLLLDVIKKNKTVADNSDESDDYFTSSLIDPTAAILTVSKSSMTQSSKRNKSNQGLLIKPHLIGLPELPQFDLNEISTSFLSTDRSFSDFRFYCGDDNNDLHEAFLQIFVLLYQLRPENELNSLSLVYRFMYSYILNFFYDGTDLSSIINNFNQFDLDVIFDAIYFLEQFEFIQRLNIDTILPHFVSDVFAQPHYFKEKVDENKYKLIKPHLWILQDGSVDIQMLQKCQMKLAEVIDSSPGIEFLEIADKMPQFTLNDLFQLLDVLELDEIIYSMVEEEQDSGLFDEFNNELFSSSALPLPNVDSAPFLYCLAIYMNDPTQKRIKKYYYPTQRNNFNLALTIIN